MLGMLVGPASEFGYRPEGIAGFSGSHPQKIINKGTEKMRSEKWRGYAPFSTLDEPSAGADLRIRSDAAALVSSPLRKHRQVDGQK